MLLAEFWDVMPGLRATLFGPNPRSGYSDPLVEPEEVRTTIRNHPDFAAFRDDHPCHPRRLGRGEHAAPWPASRPGDKPNH